MLTDKPSQWLARRIESTLARRVPPGTPAFAVRLAGGDVRAFGNGSVAATIVVNTRRGLAELASMDATRIAEAYRVGAIDLEGSLPRLLGLRDMFADRHPLTYAWRFLRPKLFGQVQSDIKWIADHYERDAAFYLRFLDATNEAERSTHRARRPPRCAGDLSDHLAGVGGVHPGIDRRSGAPVPGAARAPPDA